MVSIIMLLYLLLTISDTLFFLKLICKLRYGQWCMLNAKGFLRLKKRDGFIRDINQRLACGD